MEREIFESYLAIGTAATARRFGMHKSTVSRIKDRLQYARPSVGLIPGSPMQPGKAIGDGWVYRWHSRRIMGQYNGQTCRIVTAGDGSRQGVGGTAAGSWGCTLVVEFQDGTRVKATRVSLKKLR